MPNENYKNSFRKFTEVEINQIVNLIKFVSEKLDFKIDIEVIKKEFKKTFLLLASFFRSSDRFFKRVEK